MLTWSQLQLHSKPIGLLNVGDYFTPLLQMIDKMVEDGFLKAENKSLLIVGESIEELFEKMNNFNAEISTKWIDRA
jgi:predicted Rossmann-fold nucleotide-binding protein